MKKSLAVLLLAVLLPSVMLGWLALRTAGEQQIVLERRTAELCKAQTDEMAAGVRALVDEERREFGEIVRGMLRTEGAGAVAAAFTSKLAEAWPRKAVGFAIGRDGQLLCPTARDASTRADSQQFLWDNGAFLGNKVVATVYPVAVDELNRPEALRRGASGQRSQQKVLNLSKSLPPPPQVAEAGPGKQQESQGDTGMLVMRDAARDPKVEQYQRRVAPQQMVEPQNGGQAPSQLTWATAAFGEFTARGEEGVINRFVQDRLNMIFWVRPPDAGGHLYGCMIQAESLSDVWAEVTATESESGQARPEYVVALLDDKGRAVATRPRLQTRSDWTQPFVASEIGEALPHWEAALYLAQPEQLQRAANGLRRSLHLLIAGSLLAITAGAWVVFVDTRRQVELAQKKTDFVSNVSHELKTPLTSIRMFSELMQRGDMPREKQEQYLRIITVEAERLTRLINNVLDFARLERKQEALAKRRIDFYAVVASVWEGQELHLRQNGFQVRWDAAPPPYPVLGDPDALAQVLVNLLSNAEKYSTSTKEVTLHTHMDQTHAITRVLDRGGGVPAPDGTKIFEAFYRSHDSLSSGVTGAGLGLTLAQQLVQQHGGDIRYEARSGGGSVFTVSLPLAPGGPA